MRSAGEFVRQTEEPKVAGNDSQVPRRSGGVGNKLRYEVGRPGLPSAQEVVNEEEVSEESATSGQPGEDVDLVGDKGAILCAGVQR